MKTSVAESFETLEREIGQVRMRGVLKIKVTGIGYFQPSVVYFNDIPVPTRLVNANEQQAQVDEILLRTPGRYALVRQQRRRR